MATQFDLSTLNWIRQQDFSDPDHPVDTSTAVVGGDVSIEEIEARNVAARLSHGSMLKRARIGRSDEATASSFHARGRCGTEGRRLIGEPGNSEPGFLRTCVQK